MTKISTIVDDERRMEIMLGEAMYVANAYVNTANLYLTAASLKVMEADPWANVSSGLTNTYESIRNSIIVPLGILAIVIIALKLLIASDPQSVARNKQALIVVIIAVALCWIAPTVISWAKNLGGGS